MLSNKVKEEARKFALKNATDYGKADVGAVLSKVLATNPRMKDEIRTLSLMIKEVVNEVNKLGKKELEKQFAPHSAEFIRKEKVREEKSSKPRMELDGAVAGSFATRFPPGPNGYMHIGHAKAAFLEREFANIYKGKLFLYFDDTNPEKDREEFVDALHRDLEWLGITFDEEYYASDHIQKVYECAKKLLQTGRAYSCTCSQEEIKEKRFKGTECKHRSQSKETSMKIFEEMLAGKYEEGVAVVRFLGDMKSNNTAMRDPTLLRVKKDRHYRQGTKYVVWPTYDLNTPIVDSLRGVTDVIRSKEFELRDELGRELLKDLGMRSPRIHSEARLVIKDNITHKRELNKLIKEGVLWGFDDPRLVTISGLRRRGIQPQAIRNFVLKFGMSKMDTKVGLDLLLSENRSVVDGLAKRLFLVTESVEVKVSGIPKGSKKVALKFHPSKDLGQRECEISDAFLISGKDAKTLKPGAEFRLKDLFNVKVEKTAEKSITAKFIGNESIDAPKFQWVNAKKNVKCRLLEIGPLLVNEKFNPESLTISLACAEEYVNELAKEEIVQFERVGFFKLDDIKEKSFLSL